MRERHISDDIANGIKIEYNGKVCIIINNISVRQDKEIQMKVLIVGSGGREHAIAWAVTKSPKVEKIYCAPGNAGIAEYAECVNIGAMEFDKLVAFAKEKEIDLQLLVWMIH